MSKIIQISGISIEGDIVALTDEGEVLFRNINSDWVTLESKLFPKVEKEKTKGGALAQRVVNALAKEFKDEVSWDYSIDDMLTEWEVRGWKSF